MNGMMTDRKGRIAAALAACLLTTVSACGVVASGNHGPSSAGAPSPSQSLSASRIVFHDTIADPQADFLNTLGPTQTTGTSGLELVLSETAPNVFEGCGVMTRSLEIQGEENVSSRQAYTYRTGLIHAEAGREGSLDLTGRLTEDRETPTFLFDDAPFQLNIHKDGTLQQKSLPFLLQLEGDRASLTISMHEHAQFVFHGELTEESESSPAGQTPEPGGILYINSLWNDSFSGGGGDYTAILLASPGADGNSYSGQFSVQGTGNALESFHEAVTVSPVPFDDESYRQAGGKLSGGFAQMGVLHGEGGDYLLLLDNEQVLLEAAGKELYFCGTLRSPSEFALLQNEAEKTEQLFSDLCREKGDPAALPDFSGLTGLDPENPEDMEKLMEISGQMNEAVRQSEAPAWYPGELIPKVHWEQEMGYNAILSPEEVFFRIYGAGYGEEEDFEDLVDPYRAVLSGYDDYQECMDFDNAEGVFLFTMGRYLVQVHLVQSAWRSTSVMVQIY